MPKPLKKVKAEEQLDTPYTIEDLIADVMVQGGGSRLTNILLALPDKEFANTMLKLLTAATPKTKAGVGAPKGEFEKHSVFITVVEPHEPETNIDQSI